MQREEKSRAAIETLKLKQQLERQKLEESIKTKRGNEKSQKEAILAQKVENRYDSAGASIEVKNLERLKEKLEKQIELLKSVDKVKIISPEESLEQHKLAA